MSLIPWTTLATKAYPEPQFLLDPFIPTGGITFLYGDTSIGKSPLTWRIAECIATGTPFFGLPTTKGNVLYIELDTPELSIADRLKKFPSPPENVWWLFSHPLSIPSISGHTKEEFQKAREELHPSLVIINTLRKVHDMDDKESRTPALVYGAFQKLFPGAALLFVHHTRKKALDPKLREVDKESFSGAKNWLNDAQTGLHLEVYRSRGGKENLRLYHRKSQVSETLRPLPLLLHQDGTTLTSPLYEEYERIYLLLNEHFESSMKAGEMDLLLAKETGLGIGTCKKRRLDIEAGAFPGSRGFLKKDGEEGEDVY